MGTASLLRRNRRTVSLTILAGLSLVLPIACGGDEFDEKSCEPNYKKCGDRCVYYVSGSYGCTMDTCEPCPAPAATLKHMVASCSESFQCNAVCESGFGLCGADPSVGCDTNLQDNTHHCGWCKHDCAGALCDKGACAPVTIASGQTNPSSLTVAGKHLYWVNHGEAGAVMRAPIEGGGAPELVAGNETLPTALALNETWLFFTTQSNGGEVRSVLLADKTLATVASDPNGPAGIALQNGRVFWASEGGGEVLSLQVPPESGQTPKPIKAGLDEPRRVAASNGWIIYTAVGTGDVYCYREGENLRIATGLNPTYLTATGDEAWFVRGEGYVYHKGCEANLADQPKHVPGSNGAIGMALDADYLYFTSAQGVKRVLRDGGESPVVQTYSATTTAEEVVVNGQYVIWSEPSTGELKAVAK